MHEIFGDLWTQVCDARCITTNGFVKKDGTAVMGRGVALEAKTMFPGIDRTFGTLLKAKGNRVNILIPQTPQENARPIPALVVFPTKRVWWEDGVPELIQRSAGELSILATVENWKRVMLPKPGCGNGQLKWEDVKPLIKDILDDRFFVIDKLVV